MADQKVQSLFDQKFWSQKILQPDWYTEFVPWAQKIEYSLDKDSQQLGEFRKIIRQFFERELENGRVALAAQGPNLDAQRQSVDKVVIHHTSAKPGYRLSYMNATQLLNVYAPYFMHPTIREERKLKGTAIWSGHSQDGRMVFWLYHWLVRMDGSIERLLSDDQIGWHSGDWEINKRSIGICLDNDYENQDPSEANLQNVAAHIKKHYPQIRPKDVIGHCEAKEGTVCPGKHFMDVWKPKLLKYLGDDA